MALLVFKNCNDCYPTAEEVGEQVDEKQSLQIFPITVILGLISQNYYQLIILRYCAKNLKSKSMLVFGLNEIVAKMS